MCSLETFAFNFIDCVGQFHERSDGDGGVWLVKGVTPVNSRSIPLNSRVVVSSAIDKWFQETLMRWDDLYCGFVSDSCELFLVCSPRDEQQSDSCNKVIIVAK